MKKRLYKRQESLKEGAKAVRNVGDAVGDAPVDLTEHDQAVSLPASLTQIQPRLRMAI
ncbi:hypothetical protein [Paraburkholderia bannensis]|uniref:hypothetical protein n=1 Tax=Paraburkholderia bannensis TaxID=765414 RepID=UPI0012EB2D03|nr:hypothetical protein [Paraburkholderia bannensis]